MRKRGQSQGLVSQSEKVRGQGHWWRSQSEKWFQRLKSLTKVKVMHKCRQVCVKIYWHNFKAYPLYKCPYLVLWKIQFHWRLVCKNSVFTDGHSPGKGKSPWWSKKSRYSRGARVSFGLWILKVKGPTLNRHILNPEVVLISVWGASFWNHWEYYGLPLTSCVIFRKIET